jgi:integrase
LRPLNRFTLAKINRATIAAQLGTIAKENGSTAADRARAALSALFTWAMKEGLCEANPLLATNTAANSPPRDRVLSDAELVAIMEGAAGERLRRHRPSANPDRKPARRDRIAALVRDRFRSPPVGIARRAHQGRNHRAHDVPLSESAVAILEAIPRRKDRDLVFGSRDGAFSGWSKSKAELDGGLKLKPWRLHDVRRTVATRMADLGIQPHIIEAALNHASGHKAGVAGVYNRSTYAMEK